MFKGIKNSSRSLSDLACLLDFNKVISLDSQLAETFHARKLIIIERLQRQLELDDIMMS